MLTNKKLHEIVDLAKQDDPFERKFVCFLKEMGYSQDDIFIERNKQKINQYREEFIKGWNHGYRKDN